MIMRILICWLLLLTINGAVWAAEQRHPTATPSASSPAPSAKVSPPAKVDSEAEITHLELIILVLGIFSAIGLILPLPMAFYHFRRIKELVARIDELQLKVHEQDTQKAQRESLLARNEKLETEIKQMQERFRVTMRNTQEKHQEAIEKLKGDIHMLELENKRVSGILLLKEQIAKKSSSGN